MDADAPGVIDRIDRLTAAVADLGFRLDTLVSSTTAFRDALSERLTDYADLVAHWSMETEETLAAQRRTTERALAERDAVLQRLAEAIEKAEQRTIEALGGLEAATARRVDSVVGEVRALREALAEAGGDEGEEGEDGTADALAAVLAEVAALRSDVKNLRFPEIPAFPEIELPEPPEVDLSPLAAAIDNLRQDVASMRPFDLGAATEELRGLRRELARVPDTQAELSRLAQEIVQLRAAVAEAAADEVADAEETEGVLVSLVEEVGSLREQLASLPDPRVLLDRLTVEVEVLGQRLGERPSVPPEVTALVQELQALRNEIEETPESAVAEGAPGPAAVEVAGIDEVRDQLAELSYEVRTLRRRLFPSPRTRGAKPADDAD